MRKVDYQILAAAVEKHGITHAFAPYHYDTAAHAEGARQAAERIARTFARFANVDKVEFLKACGIE